MTPRRPCRKSVPVLEIVPDGTFSKPWAVNVHDERGDLICYCGPYSREEAEACALMFCDAGWGLLITLAA